MNDTVHLLAMTTHTSDVASDRRATRDQRHDLWFKRSMLGAAMLVLLLLASIAASTLWGGRLAFKTFGLDFLTSTEWDAVNNHFGALVPIYGTLMTSFLALLIAVPVSFGIAIFLTEVAPPWLRMPVASAVELLAGIPSIIYGMWGCSFSARSWQSIYHPGSMTIWVNFL